jgi:hypothetical protein
VSLKDFYKKARFPDNFCKLWQIEDKKLLYATLLKKLYLKPIFAKGKEEGKSSMSRQQKRTLQTGTQKQY